MIYSPPFYSALHLGNILSLKQKIKVDTVTAICCYLCVHLAVSLCVHVSVSDQQGAPSCASA